MPLSVRSGLALLAALALVWGCGYAAPLSPGGKAPGPAPRFDSWHVIGPGGGGGQFCPTVSPHDPNVVLERCDMTGSYLTTDGGLSWRMINFATVIEAFAFDAKSPKLMYAGSDALYRSDDAGATWRMILPDPAKNTVAHLLGDHAGAVYTTDDTRLPKGQFRVQALAIDPGAEGHLYVGLSLSPESGQAPSGSYLYETKDRGATWSRVGYFGGDEIFAIRVGPQKTPVVYVVTNGGVCLLSGDKWTRNAPPAEGIGSAAIGYNPETGRVLIYATSQFRVEGDKLAGGVYVSEDAGKTWRTCKYDFAGGGGRWGPRITCVACSAGHPQTAYFGLDGVSQTRADGSQVSGSGIARTTDGGRHWKLVHFEGGAPSASMELSWFEPRVTPGSWDLFFSAPFSIGVAPTNPEVCYATDYFRTYGTKDGGKTWQQLISAKVGDKAWATRGLDVTTNYGVHFDPFDPTHVYISYTDIGMFRSEDGGASWISSIAGVREGWRNTTYWLEFDPAVKGLVWGGFSGTHDLPRPKMWRGRGPTSYRGGVGVSTDGGKTWAVAGKGMAQTAVTHVLLDPTSPAGKRTLYACGYGTGLWKSTDNGETWTLRNKGIEQQNPFAWRIVRLADGTLCLIIARRNDTEAGEDDPADNGGLYRSTDGAETWTKVKLPGGCTGPNGLAVDPRDPKRLYLAAWGSAAMPHDLGGGVFLSTDGGATWRNVFSQSQHVYDVTLDPKHPDTLYICGFDSAAYRSADAGKTWSRIKGYNFKWGHRVVLDPVHADMIYITTFGGSVWHGPAAGDPKALEDVVTPVPTM